MSAKTSEFRHMSASASRLYHRSAEEEALVYDQLVEAVEEVAKSHNFIVIDTPGHPSPSDVPGAYDGRYLNNTAERQLRRL